jgi:flagellar assembly protein FliH
MFSSEHDFTPAWLPDQLEVEAFELPEFGAVETAATFGEVPAAAPMITVRDVEAAVYEALARQEEHEVAVRGQIQAEAYAAGVAQGRAEATEAGRVALASALEALWLAAEEVRAGEARWLAALEDNIAALAAAAARHVVAREVRADDALVRELALRAVAEYPQDHPLAIRVHPADVATLKQALAESSRAGETRWIPDARVERGGCILEGRDRIVDGRVDTALERVYRTLSGHHA